MMGDDMSEVRGALRDMRADFRQDLTEALAPIVRHLETLNGRTGRNEVAIAVLQTQAKLVAAMIGLAAGVAGAVAVEAVRLLR